MRWKKNSGRAVRVGATGLRKFVEMTMVVENVLFFDPEIENPGMDVSRGLGLCSGKNRAGHSRFDNGSRASLPLSTSL